MSKIQAFEFNIRHKRGKMNFVADALSRKPVLALMRFHDDWKLMFEVEYAKTQFTNDLFDGIFMIILSTSLMISFIIRIEYF